VAQAQAIALVALVATTAVLVRQRGRTRVRVRARSSVAPQSVPNPSPGVVVRDGCLVVDSYDALFALLPDALEQARRDGVRGAEPILATVFARLLPRHQWPPQEGSSLETQWRLMVKDVAELFELDPEPTRQTKPGLRVVE
jgi:hypothetical protein